MKLFELKRQIKMAEASLARLEKWFYNDRVNRQIRKEKQERISKLLTMLETGDYE